MVWTVMLCWENKTTAMIGTLRRGLHVIGILTYPAILQHLAILAKSQLSTGLVKLPQTTDGKVLLIQLFGCNQSFRLEGSRLIISATVTTAMSQIKMFRKSEVWLEGLVKVAPCGHSWAQRACPGHPCMRQRPGSFSWGWCPSWRPQSPPEWDQGDPLTPRPTMSWEDNRACKHMNRTAR